MGVDIISTMLRDRILRIYRPVAFNPIDKIKQRDKKVYELLRIVGEINCIVFSEETDGLKNYEESGEYEKKVYDLITKYPVREEDIVVVRDEARVHAYQVKTSEFLSLEPLVTQFKNYSCTVIKYSGEIQLTDNSKIKFTPEYFGPDERF